MNVFNTNQHPFAAIYGNNFLPRNDFHVNSFTTNWFRIAQDEGLLGNLITCPGPPQPVTPFVIANQSLDPCFANNQSVTFTAVNTGDISQYSHDWALLSAGIFGSGNTFTFNTNQLIPGVQYTLICTRRFTNQGYSTATSSYSIIFSVCEPTGGNASPCTFNQGDFVYLLGDGQGAYARYHNGTLYAAKTEGDTYEFVSRSTLIANGMVDTFANCFAETDPRGGGGNLSLQNGCYTFKSKLSNKMMQMDGDGNGAKIRQYGANGQNNQIFKLEAVDGDAYKIMAATSNRTIESPGGSTGYNTELQLWDYNGSNHQKWQLVNMNDGSYRLNPKHESQVVMDVTGANSNDGSPLQLYGIHNGDNQRFMFASVGCPNTHPAPALIPATLTIPVAPFQVSTINTIRALRVTTGAMPRAWPVNPPPARVTWPTSRSRPNNAKAILVLNILASLIFLPKATTPSTSTAMTNRGSTLASSRWWPTRAATARCPTAKNPAVKFASKRANTP